MTETGVIDVVIAGLGPTGLVLAHVLGQRGHQVTVLERDPVAYDNARAVYTDDECLRIFQSIGVAAELQEKMVLETPIQLTRPDGTVLLQYMPRHRPYGWPVVSFFYQPDLEATLSERLAAYPNVQVCRGREVTGFAQDDDGVTVHHRASASGQGSPAVETLRARYLVGADGGRSVVRSTLGVAMVGESFPEPWLVVDLELRDKERLLRHLPYFSFVLDPARPAVVCVQPGGHQRFEFRLGPDDSKEEMERPETARRLLARFLGDAGDDAYQVKRQVVYTFNALMAERWRDRRVILAGDAAHMAPQFMGQGASAGIRDAANVGWKLDLVLRGRASEALLDSYERERRGHAQAMIDVSVQLKKLVSMTNPAMTSLRDLVLQLVTALPFVRDWVREGGWKPAPVYGAGTYLGLPRRRRGAAEGTLAPQPEVRRFDGRRLLLDEVLGPGFALIGLGVDPRTHLTPASQRALATLGTRFVAIYPYGGRPQGPADAAGRAAVDPALLEDFGGEMISWFARGGVGANAIAVLRPDRFVFAVAAPSALDAAVGELARQLGALD